MLVQKLMAGEVFNWWEVGMRGKEGLKFTTREPGTQCVEEMSGECKKPALCVEN